MRQPPQSVTNGIQVAYSFPDNPYSVNRQGMPDKTPFWQYAQQLFGLSQALPANIGLAGKGLAGVIYLKGDHCEAVGIPLTEFSDSEVLKHPGNPVAWQRQRFQLARIAARDAGGRVLSENRIVAPVSTEVQCDTCHADGQREGVGTGSIETNILALHDHEEQTAHRAHSYMR